jgi:hypothetical protein
MARALHLKKERSTTPAANTVDKLSNDNLTDIYTISCAVIWFYIVLEYTITRYINTILFNTVLTVAVSNLFGFNAALTAAMSNLALL